jgi:environmental stress-induced protein Ves
MNWVLVPLASVTPQPWRNGGGLTRELLPWPSPADWRVRLSIADVQAAGPFSRFEGVERWFAVLEGEGVVLRIGGDAHRLTRDSEPLRFDGAAAVDCKLLANTTRDFNLMAAPGRSRMHRVRRKLAFSTRGPALLALYAHDQPARVALGDEGLDVPAFHLAWRAVDGPAGGTVSGEDALWMEAMT